jgi:hypothetical protein
MMRASADQSFIEARAHEIVQPPGHQIRDFRAAKMGVLLMNTRDHYFPLKVLDYGDIAPRLSYFFFFFAAFFFVAIV